MAGRRIAVDERLARQLADASGAEWRATRAQRRARASLARRVAKASERYSVRAIAEAIDRPPTVVHALIHEAQR